MCQVLRTYIHVGIRSRWVYLTIKSEWFTCVNAMSALKTVNCHDTNFAVKGDTGGCHGVVIMPTLSSLVASVVVLTTTGATIDDKVGIVTALVFQWYTPAKGNMDNYCHICWDYFMHAPNKVPLGHLSPTSISGHYCHRTISTSGHHVSNDPFINLRDNFWTQAASGIGIYAQYVFMS